VNLIDETCALRHKLAGLAAQPPWDFLARHDLLTHKRPKTLARRLWRIGRNVLTRFKILPPHVTSYPWFATLKHVPKAQAPTTLLIWAVDVQQDKLRKACAAFAARLAENENLAPVLVTDVADFALYSRLGWLVEYVPDLQPRGRAYKESKLGYLAWRYRNAVIVPLAAAFASEMDWQKLLR